MAGRSGFNEKAKIFLIKDLFVSSRRNFSAKVETGLISSLSEMNQDLRTASWCSFVPTRVLFISRRILSFLEGLCFLRSLSGCWLDCMTGDCIPEGPGLGDNGSSLIEIGLNGSFLIQEVSISVVDPLSTSFLIFGIL